MLLLLRGRFAYSFNNNHYNSTLLHSHTSNIHKFGNKITWTPSSMPNWYYYRGILLQYLHFFLLCECGYANEMHALWTAGFRWLIPATHLQLAFVWGWTVSVVIFSQPHPAQLHEKKYFYFHCSSLQMEENMTNVMKCIFWLGVGNSLFRDVRWGSSSLLYIVLPEI